MLKNVAANHITLCELVEHPGGHDGGEFPQDHTYGVADDGAPYYSTDFPDCPTDVFCDEEPEDLTQVETKEGAVNVLKSELTKAKFTVECLERLIPAFEKSAGFTTRFGDED